MRDPLLTPLVEDAIAARQPLLDAAHEGTARLFSGFTEGYPHIVIDLYGATAVVHNYADPPALGFAAVQASLEAIRACLPWVRTALTKNRNAPSKEERTGTLAFGDHLDDFIVERNLLYALDLRLHQDCTLYLDTRDLRRWAQENLSGKTVLNGFAYTGSLGVAASGGGAARVAQLDRSRTFLNLAQRSYALNHFPIRKHDFIAADFFHETARLRRQHLTFDCVFLDPPFFSSGSSGVVDQVNSSARLINKARPLVAPGGRLVAINNALYVSGADYMRTLEQLCEDGYMQVEELLPIPADFIGMRPVPGAAPITNPTPFNHSTKIAVLRVAT